MEYTLPIYCLGILKFEILFIGSVSFFTILGLILAFANSFLPITIFTDYIIQLPSRELIEVSYDDSEIQFSTVLFNSQGLQKGKPCYLTTRES